MSKETRTEKEIEAEKALKNLSVLSTKVNETLNYINEYRKQGLMANANDMMVLYKVVSEYEKKIKSYLSGPGKFTGTNNTAQYADLVGRCEDASENKRNIAKVISDSMNEIKFDAKNYKTLLKEKLTDRDLKREDTKELLAAIDNYRSFDSDRDINEHKKIGRANAKQRLVNACIGYVKNSKNKEAKNIVYDIAAIMGKQNVLAFNKLNDEELSAMSTRRYIGYRTNTLGNFKTHCFKNSIGPSELSKSGIVEKLGPNSKLTQQEKDAEFDKYMANLYGNDRFASFTAKQYEQVDKELGKDATKAERRQKLGELAYKEAPWNKIKLDDTTKSKEAFAHRQKVMRKWFPDDAMLLFGATVERNTARNYYELLDNKEYNGFFRSLKNSPEYTALMKSLKTYTKKSETNVIKDQKNLEAIKVACVKYLDRCDKKEEMSEFAKKRNDKVKELLDSLGGASMKTEKAVEKKKVGTLTNFKELDKAKNDTKTMRKQEKVKSKDLCLGL